MKKYFISIVILLVCAIAYSAPGDKTIVGPFNGFGNISTVSGIVKATKPNDSWNLIGVKNNITASGKTITITGFNNISGMSGSAAKLDPGSNINGVHYDGSTDITIPVIGSVPFPNISSAVNPVFVPYSSATKDVDLNGKHLVNVNHLGIGSNALPDVLIRAIGDNGTLSRISMRGYSNDSSSSSIRVSKFRGTLLSPSTVLSGDSLGKFEVGGYSAFGVDGLPASIIEGTATEDWTLLHNGSNMLFKVTANGTLGPATALTLNQDKSATFSASVNIAGTAGTGYITLSSQSTNPTAPPAGTLLLHSATTQGFTRLEQDNEAPTNLVLGRDNVFIAKNTSGSTINPGQPVYVTGSTGNVPNIGLSKADSTTTVPAIGVALDSIANNAFGQVMHTGIISGVNTSAYLTGDNLWVSPSIAGGLVNARPTYPYLIQRIGKVLVSGVGNGSIQVVTAPFIGGMESGTTSSWQSSGTVTGTQLISNVATGTPPLSVTSTTPVANLNIGGSAAKLTTPVNINSVPFDGSTNIQTATANTSDYTSGTFTPILSFGVGTIGITYSRQVGTYTKIGNRVFYNVTITLTSKGSSTGTAVISGLPITSSSVTNNFSTASIYADSMSSGLTQFIDCYILTTATTINLAKLVNGTSTLLADTDFTDSTILVITGNYPI